MPVKVQLENGRIIEFEREPTGEDIDYAIEQMGGASKTQLISPRKDLIDKITGISPRQLSESGHPVLGGLQQTAKDVFSIPAHFFNQMGLNTPRAALRAANVDYPEAESPTGKFLSRSAGVVGGVAGLPAKLLTKAPALILPRLAGEGLKRKALRSAVGGALTAGAYTPTESKIPLIAPRERVAQAVQGGLIGGAIPIAGAGLKTAGKGIGKGVDYLKKSAADYITTKVAPKAHSMYQQAVNKFTPEIQEFAEKTLSIPKTAIENVKKMGVGTAQKLRQFYNDSTDFANQKIQQGFSSKRAIADEAYNQAIELAPENKFIDIRPSIEKSGKVLKRLGLITEKGNLTELGKSEISQDSVYGKLLDFYKSADDISGVAGLQGKDLTQSQMVKASKAMSETNVNKYQYQFLRDKLNSLYKNRPSDKDVGNIVNEFYANGEASGIKGLQQARSLQRQAFQAEEKFLDSKGNIKALGKETTLDRFHKLSQEQVRQLREIEKYTGVNFVDDVSNLTAARELDKLSGLNPDTFANDLNKAIDPKWTKFYQQKYEKILGKDKAKEIFDEIVAHRRGVKIKKTVGLGSGIVAAEELGRRGFRLMKGD